MNSNRTSSAAVKSAATGAASKRSSKADASVAYYTLSGDVNNDMVHRLFEAASAMSADGVKTAHILFQSHGGYVSDGICLYNYLSNLGVRIITYNCGAVASIAVAVFLTGTHRVCADTARFMLHKSHASPAGGSGSGDLKILAEGLIADDARTEAIFRKHLRLSVSQWKVHAHADLHLTSADALKAGLVHEIGVFAPPPGARVINI
jgi:ATP-dependent Clp protease protease subunit